MMIRFLVLLAALAAAPAYAVDRDGADHPLLPRYAGSDIDSYRGPSLDRISLPLAAVTNAQRAKTLHLEGQVTHINYKIMPAVSTLQIGRYYDGVLRDGRFKILLSCSGLNGCGGDMVNFVVGSGDVAPIGFSRGEFSGRLRTIVAQHDTDYIILMIEEAPAESSIYEAVVTGAHEVQH